ncbi:MAG: hypothetical protein ACMG50_02130 [Thermomonas sp.]
MNPNPPKSPHVLDAEERALAKGLPRLHGRTAPGPDLDASILAAAQAAVQPAKPPRVSIKPRFRWIAPASLAASMVLAVGMAWQLRPLPELQAPQPAASAMDVTASEPAVLETEPATSDKPAPMNVMPPPIASPIPQANEQVIPSPPVAPQDMPGRDDRPAPAQFPQPPPPPPALPAPSASAVATPAPPTPLAAMAAKSSPPTESQAGAPQTQSNQDGMRARTAAPATTANATGMTQAATADKASMADSARSPAASPSRTGAAATDVHNEAAMAADAGFVDDPGVDVPPATAASPAVRDAWLRRISQLLEQGNRQDAKASLAEFKRRYPNAVLPPALKALDIEP